MRRDVHTKSIAANVAAGLMLIGTSAAAVDPLALTLVQASSEGWPHLVGPQGFMPEFSLPDFDDSAWALGSAPFGFGTGCGYPIATAWQLNSDLLLRRWITLPAPGILRVSAAIDNDVQAFIDGQALSDLQQFDGCGLEFRYVADSTPREPGTYLIAVRARDRGGESFLDVIVEGVFSDDCNDDGIVDYSQILDGTVGDLNDNGIPDACECLADVNQDGVVNGADISAVLGFWGLAGKPLPAADITRDGVVDGADLAVLLGSWGECP